VSLILDALRKLERDKQARDPGVVVVGQVPWRGRDRSRGVTRVVLGTLALLVVAATAGLMWLSRPDGTPTATAPPPAPRETLPAEAGPAPGPIEPTTADQTPLSGAASSAPPSPTTSPKAPPPREMTLPEPPPTEETTPAAEEPEAAAPTPRPPLLLTAISERDGKPVAVLNDRLVHEGDSIDGVRVLRIGPTEVEVEIDGRREVIRF